VGTADPAAVRAAHLAAVRARASLQPLAKVHDLAAGVGFGPQGFVLGSRKTVRRAGITRPVVRTMTEVARALSDEDKNPFAGTTSKVRAHTLEHLLPFLLKGTAPGRRMSTLDVRARAASFALLVRLAEGMTTRGESGKRAALIEVLLDAAVTERHKGLKRHMLIGLDGLPKRMLGGAALRRRNALVEGLRPTKPPYDEWFAGQAKPRLNVVQYVQDEFWRREVANLRKLGFKIEVSANNKSAVATKILKDPAGKHPDVSARVKLLQRDDAVLEAMGDEDVHMVLYTGHAGVGGIASTSLELAPAAEGPPKVIGFLACRTKQNLAGLQRAFPDAHVLTSDRGTYGNDDRIVIAEMLAGVARRASWSDIEASAEAHDLWEKDNYIFPGEGQQLELVDLDDDGRADLSGRRRDLLYDFELRKGAGHSISMLPSRKTLGPNEQSGAKLTDAVGWFNSVWHYWTADYGNAGEKEMADRFRQDGFFESDDPDDIVRIEEVRQRGAKPTWRVKLNSAYAHQDPHAVAILTTWGMTQKLLAASRPDMSEYDRRMTSMALVCSYLINVNTYSDTGDALLRSFAKRFGFPPSLTFDVAWSAVMSDHDHEASPKVLARLEKGMQYPFLEVNAERTSVEFRTYIQGALKKLKNSDTEIGRRTFELIATGQVKIDELSDLSRGDYNHIRAEFMRDGIDLPVSGYDTLHDGRTKAMRAIRDSIHGYMWDDRVYVVRGMSPDMLAKTLVHEVNHVLNQSEEHYRSKEAIFREEYRAYLSEAMLAGKTLDAAARRKLKAAVIRDYELGLDPDAMPDDPGGRFFPDPPHAHDDEVHT
jgi:hypothetical protein